MEEVAESLGNAYVRAEADDALVDTLNKPGDTLD